MNRRKRIKRVFSALLAAVFLCILALPAAAEEGDSGYPGAVEPSGDEEPGAVEPVPPEEEDPTPPPADDPTPPPADDPTPPPEGEPTPPPEGEPTPPPEGDPTPPPEGEPTPTPDGEEPTPGPEDPTPEPTEEPTQAPPPEEFTGGGDNTPSNTAPRAPIGSGSGIVQPSFSPRSTAPPITSSASSEEEDPATREPRYITFARVTQKTNSMSRVLYYGGVSSIGVGVLGLLILLIFVIRNRRIDARNDRIFEEIAQAEIRQPAPARPRQPEHEAYDGGGYSGTGGDVPPPPGGQEPDYPQDYGYEAPPPAVHRPEPEALTVPVNGSVYTEEFDIPRPAPEYQAPPSPPPVQPPANPDAAPALTSMYTEEFLLPEDMAQPAPPVREDYQPGAPQPPARQPVQPAQAPARDDSYDTTELLREILHGDQDR